VPNVLLKGDAVAWTETDADEVVVLDLRTSRYLSLNASGALLWKLLADGSTTDHMRSVLSETYDLSDDAAETDVVAFLDALRTRDLIVE
jgi:hypothetical protein